MAPEIHRPGYVSIENLEIIQEALSDLQRHYFGYQIADDGRVWICIDGIAFIRFSPHANGRMSAPKRCYHGVEEPNGCATCDFFLCPWLDGQDCLCGTQ